MSPEEKTQCIEVTRPILRSGGKTAKITFVLCNKGLQSLRFVEVEFALFSANGRVIGKALDIQSNFAPGETRTACAVGTAKEKVLSFRLTQINTV